jgi:hypothetical protein
VRAADELIRIVDAAAQELRLINAKVASVKMRPEVWSIKEILGHLLDSAANNHQRFVRAQHTDILVFPGYDQDAWVRFQDYQQYPWLELIELWRLYNRQLAHILRRIPESKLGMACKLSPDLPGTLGDVIAHYVTHLEHHLQQIEERKGGITTRSSGR